MPEISTSYRHSSGFGKSYRLAERLQARHLLWIFVILHGLLWTLGPALLRPSLPHDVLEGISWGMQWQWGYNKHPFLTAWLLAAVTQGAGVVGWPAYLLAQLINGLSFYWVWRLASALLPSRQALLATLSLEGVLFYNINSFNLTPDSLQAPLWAGLAFCLWQAVSQDSASRSANQQQRIAPWLATGILAALCILCKYQAAVLFLPLLLWLLINPEARHSFRRPGLWIGLVTALILISPHLLWLAQHDLISIRYAFATPGDYTQTSSALGHLYYPIRLLLNAIGNVLPMLLLLWPFFSGWPRTTSLSPLARSYLFTIAFGPLILTLLLAVFSGDHFPPRWLTPYFFGLGLWFFSRVAACSDRQLRQFLLSLLVLSLSLLTGRLISFSPALSGHSDSWLPHRVMAQQLESVWVSRYHRPLPVLAGSHYLVAVLNPYFVNRPRPFFNLDPQESPWMRSQSWPATGGLIVWDKEGHYLWDKSSENFMDLPAWVIKDYPRLQFLPDMLVSRANQALPPIRIGVALLPPADKE